MNFFEAGPFPGMPYLVAAAFTGLAIAVSYRIPDEEEYQDYLDSKLKSEVGTTNEEGLLLNKNGLANDNFDDSEDDQDTFQMAKSDENWKK